MNEGKDSSTQTNDQRAENELANRIRVCTAATALNHAVQERFYNHHFYYFQAGFLLPHRVLQSDREACYGGLNEEQTLFVLVPKELVEQRKRTCLIQIARERLGMDDQEQLAAYCTRAEREVSTGAHHTHPAFQAETQACQVDFWLGQLKQRRILPEACWSW